MIGDAKVQDIHRDATLAAVFVGGFVGNAATAAHARQLFAAATAIRLKLIMMLVTMRTQHAFNQKLRRAGSAFVVAGRSVEFQRAAALWAVE